MKCHICLFLLAIYKSRGLVVLSLDNSYIHKQKQTNNSKTISYKNKKNNKKKTNKQRNSVANPYTIISVDYPTLVSWNRVKSKIYKILRGIANDRSSVCLYRSSWGIITRDYLGYLHTHLWVSRILLKLMIKIFFFFVKSNYKS